MTAPAQPGKTRARSVTQLAKEAMVKDVHMGKRVRKSFAHIEEVLEMPDLIEIQKNSYNHFLKEGLREVLNDVFPITDYAEKLVLEFVDYDISTPPKFTVEECKELDQNYSAPLKVTVRLLNTETGEVKESEAFLGDFPIMTEQGTFVYNGAERVIVSQLMRSPGVYFDVAKDKSGRELFSSQIIPNRGAWLEYETDSNDVLYVRIDRTRKIPLTLLLRAIGLGTDEEIVATFGEDERLTATLNKDAATTKAQSVADGLIAIYKQLRPGEPPTEESARSLLNSLYFDPRRYDIARVGRYKFNKKLALSARIAGRKAAENVADPNTGELLCEEGQLISRDLAVKIQDAGVYSVLVQQDDRVIKVIGNHLFCS